MAAGIHPHPPGSEYGPCAEPCRHVDCALSRADAASTCRLCRKPIGYGNRIYADPGTPRGQYVHESCMETRS